MEKNWYVVHTYSGYENKVKANLEKRVESMGMQDKSFSRRRSGRDGDGRQKRKTENDEKESVPWLCAR